MIIDYLQHLEAKAVAMKGNAKTEFLITIKYSLIGGILFALMSVFGFYAKNGGTLFGKNNFWIWFVPLAIVWTIICFYVLLLFSLIGKKDAGEPFANRICKKSVVYYVVVLAVLFIMWAPTLLALYPGLYTYDASWQHDMFEKCEVTEHHPVWHTYLIGWCTTTFETADGMNKGVLVYTLIQMLIMGLGCAYVPYVLHKRKAPFAMHILTLLFFGCYPTFAIFVFTNTKDSLFAVAIADFVLLNLMLIDEGKKFFDSKSNIVLWIVFALEILTLRNNAIYAIFVVIPFFSVRIIKGKYGRVKPIIMVAVTLLLYLIYKFPITNAVTIEGISKAEMLSVPCQQVVRVYLNHGDELSFEEKQMIENVFNYKDGVFVYQPQIADATKGALEIDKYERKKKEYRELWWNLLKRYPDEYIDSVAENTFGFWYLFPRYVSYQNGLEIYTPIECKGPAMLNSKLPGLLSFYKEFETGEIVDGNHFVSWLFAPATFFYIFIIVSLYAIKEKGAKFILPSLLILALWATYLLGPVAMVRYALYLYALIPVWPEYIRTINSDRRCE